MRPLDLTRLFILSALWGGSFIFIRVGAIALGPTLLVETRVLVAGLALLAYAAVTRVRIDLASKAGSYAVTGALNAAIPFVLIAAAEVHLTASMAAILNATTPLFGAVAAAIWLNDKLTASKLAGIAIAIVGVVVLVGWSPLAWNLVTVASIGASLLGALSYGLAGVYIRAKIAGSTPVAMATGSLLASALLLGPAVPFTLPHYMPSVTVVLCALALALFCTSIALILYFRLIANIGPTKAQTVTFLTPIFGVLWGRLFLGEPIGIEKVVACAVILAGTTLVTGTLKRQPPVLPAAADTIGSGSAVEAIAEPAGTAP